MEDILYYFAADVFCKVVTFLLPKTKYSIEEKKIPPPPYN